ncbi:MAG: hypothetical protein WA770_03550, partial [Pseudolabrys sp.]
GPSENLVEPLFVQVAEIGMRKLMSEHEGKLGICVSYAQDARVNDDSVAGRKVVSLISTTFCGISRSAEIRAAGRRAPFLVGRFPLQG